MLQQLKTSNFGLSMSGATGSLGVGYEVLDVTGAIVIARTTSGVYEPAPGIYSAFISFPDEFHGQIVWDTGSAFSTTQYAIEEFNYEANNPKLDNVYDIEYGRWRIVTNQMIFYASDNATEVARFNLFDENGNPTMDAPFERRRV